ncbi:MAG TPA: DUF4136 domain-containing protein [Cyclobacteriaceae bacterium]|nr:DUF4136 domain-containing protein [Cyclobacteriaceae bacterium]
MKRFAYVLFVLALAGCSSTQVTYDIDNTVDFTKFKTYAFAPEVATLPVQELNKNRMIAAVEKELGARGFTKSESNPDVLVDMQVKAQQRQEAVTTGTGGYGYGYRWGGGMGMQTTQINNYVDGSLFINMISNGNLIWQGRGTRTIDENATPQEREQNIKNGVAAIFAKYPVKPTAK